MNNNFGENFAIEKLEGRNPDGDNNFYRILLRDSNIQPDESLKTNPLSRIQINSFLLTRLQSPVSKHQESITTWLVIRTRRLSQSYQTRPLLSETFAFYVYFHEPDFKSRGIA